MDLEIWTFSLRALTRTNHWANKACHLMRFFFLLVATRVVYVAMSLSSTTIVVGLNGALQKRFVLPQESLLVPGNVHRASAVQVGVGGKGQDVAIALDCLRYRNSVKLVQFVGSGNEGDQVHELLQDRLGLGALDLTIRTASHMRTCTTIVASDTSTELVEPSGVVTEKEIQSLLQKLENQGEAAAELCFMGTMPPGCSPNLYAQIYKRLYEKSGDALLCVIDSVVGLEPLLQAMADNPCTTILKLNASELCRLAGVIKSIGEADGVTSAELVEATKGMLQKYPTATDALCGLAITDGKHPAHFIALSKKDPSTLDFGIHRIRIVDLQEKGGTTHLYPIGAGDTVAAGTLAAWKCFKAVAGGKAEKVCVDSSVQSVLEASLVSDVEEPLQIDVPQMLSAFAFGLACGSASCLQEQNSVFDVKDAVRLFRQTPPSDFVISETMEI